LGVGKGEFSTPPEIRGLMRADVRQKCAIFKRVPEIREDRVKNGVEKKNLRGFGE
jgi:hypothetical protein